MQVMIMGLLAVFVVAMITELSSFFFFLLLPFQGAVALAVATAIVYHPLEVGYAWLEREPCSLCYSLAFGVIIPRRDVEVIKLQALQSVARHPPYSFRRDAQSLCVRGEPVPQVRNRPLPIDRVHVHHSFHSPVTLDEQVKAGFVLLVGRPDGDVAPH
eukprot:CAMPEP_0185273232 /NCGR_PEP_ID=MMETSP1359-20130426/49039_1 /TAXON_ID=552665 /ORGANISM="Bigelowiella longifila, Strain CCMP242" /LENGTH=157 /DNA_ID=CAMNT_0027865785 /DNA_START=209 /DNA_END=682 /DNA_ORIENTATION=-